MLVIEVDGGGASMICSQEFQRRRKPKRKVTEAQRHHRRKRRKEHPKRRRTKGKKSKNSKFSVVGAIYTLRKRLVDFPLAEVCLAWIYVTEKVWTVAECIFAEG